MWLPFFMTILKPYYLALLLFSGLAYAQDSIDSEQFSNDYKVVLSDYSYLHINGNTNINEFSCDYKEFKGPDTLTLNRYRGKQIVRFNGSVLSLKVDEINCGNRMMNADLQDLLNAQQYPEIRIALKNHNPGSLLSDLSSKRHDGQGSFAVDIEIAGVTKEAQLAIINKAQEEKSVTYLGSIDLNILDFGLTPPSKFMGLVKVKETIEIELMLQFDLVD